MRKLALVLTAALLVGATVYAKDAKDSAKHSKASVHTKAEKKHHSTVNVKELMEGAALVKKSDCLSCHNATHKLVGPAYIDVAKRYKGKKGAVETLVEKVKKGGSGNWGAVPMSAHATISNADLTKMVKWILAGAPSEKQLEHGHHSKHKKSGHKKAVKKG